MSAPTNCQCATPQTGATAAAFIVVCILIFIVLLVLGITGQLK